MNFWKWIAVECKHCDGHGTTEVLVTGKYGLATFYKQGTCDACGGKGKMWSRFGIRRKMENRVPLLTPIPPRPNRPKQGANDA